MDETRIRALALASALGLGSALGGCSQYVPPPREAPALLEESRDARAFPVASRLARLGVGSVRPVTCEAHVDFVDGARLTTAPYDAGERVRVFGWAMAAEPLSTATTVRAAWLPYAGRGEGTWLSGTQTPRDDLGAAGNPRVTGYDVSGRMPRVPGYYRFVMVFGTGARTVVCDTHRVVTVRA